MLFKLDTLQQGDYNSGLDVEDCKVKRKVFVDLSSLTSYMAGLAMLFDRACHCRQHGQTMSRTISTQSVTR